MGSHWITQVTANTITTSNRLYISFTDSSCTCKLIKHVTLVTVCSFSHLSCGSYFPLSACTVQNIPVCWHFEVWWMISFGRENTSLLISSKPQLLFIPVCADGHFLLSRMPIFDTENLTHIAFLIIVFIPALNYWFVAFFPWYRASTPDYNLAYVTGVTHRANSQSDLRS